MKKYFGGLLLLGLMVFSGWLLAGPGPVESHAGSSTAQDLISGAPQDVPIANKVTMVDLGAHKCIPCKMMAPIIKALSAEYDGRAAIVFIDVWENPHIPKKFGIRTIPTQIFYDAKGVEQYRHEGFMDKDSIVSILQVLGAS